ncbi:geobacillin-26 family protein [Tepidibacter sp. Z1-5]|uniref:geobacillin-26 family protein n=1 Tax=Tepidibacter sp. Z1-5 TaxID=3134138 RepID=UPI0030BE9891
MKMKSNVKNKAVILAVTASLLLGTVGISFADSEQINSNVSKNSTIECSSEIKIIEDNDEVRKVSNDGIIATYYKETGKMEVEENGRSYTLDTKDSEAKSRSKRSYNSDTFIDSESVHFHSYKYYKTNKKKYYWIIDIPSYSWDIMKWCDPIRVDKDGSEKSERAEKFEGYIDKAQTAEHSIGIIGGATAGALIVAYATENPEWSESTMKTIYAAGGVSVSYGLINASRDYYDNIMKARKQYFAIKNEG